MPQHLFFMCAECGVCANRLRQEHSEGAGHQKTGQPPRHHRAEGGRGAHAQITQGLSERRQLRHHPHRHHQEHCARTGQAQGGRMKNMAINHSRAYATFSPLPTHHYMKGLFHPS